MSAHAQPAKARKPAKVQLKTQIDPGIHTKLRRLCATTRRTPAHMIEFLVLEADARATAAGEPRS